VENYKPTPSQRAIIDALKSNRPIITFGGRNSGKRWLLSIAVSELAKERGGIELYDCSTRPPGTPPCEALPVIIPDETHPQQG
jgi:hypothetical protein